MIIPAIEQAVVYVNFGSIVLTIWIIFGYNCVRKNWRKRMPFRRRVMRFIFKWIFKLLTRVEVSGMENVPEEGGLILAVNHFSRIDPVLLYVNMKRTDFTGLAADSTSDVSLDEMYGSTPGWPGMRK